MHKGEMHITLKDLKDTHKQVVAPIKEKIKNVWGGIKIISGFTSKKKLQQVDDEGYEEGKSKIREIDIPDPYIPPEG
jgi:hypothetical protein|tara:strand:+ start:4893 stop:5123 length:231 start_codon:yes stop_codon:yes gene_type:complete